MESCKFVAVLLCVLFGVCASRPESQLIYENQVSEEAPVKYDFEWAVKDDSSGNDFGHQESRDGSDTKGSYYVLLPDTRRQAVTYYVTGDSGYVAVVEYEGEAVFPTPQPLYEPQPPQIYSE